MILEAQIKAMQAEFAAAEEEMKKVIAQSQAREGLLLANRQEMALNRKSSEIVDTSAGANGVKSESTRVRR